GTGAIFLEILKRANGQNRVCGIDFASKNAQRTKHVLKTAGHRNAGLYQADARRLPFREAAFDVIYCIYLLDLLALKDMPHVLSEFNRVLHQGGRVVLVNLSKDDPEELTWMERFYSRLPPAWVPYLLGSCRAVFKWTSEENSWASSQGQRLLQLQSRW